MSKKDFKKLQNALELDSKAQVMQRLVAPPV